MLLLGTAWAGGQLPLEWRLPIIEALNNGMDVVNGLHDFLENDPEISNIAFRNKRKLYDVRKSPESLPVASGKARDVKAVSVLTVGSDCSVGKMTVALDMRNEAIKRGHSANFVATGQTGIMICGQGIAIDRVIGDFMAGACEELVLEADDGCEYIFVEGQGSLIHPGFSGVTLSILHGCCPQALILCHNASRKEIKGTDFLIPELSKLIRLNEEMSDWMRPAKVIGIALNTRELSDSQAKSCILRLEEELNLPVTDTVRYGAAKLMDGLLGDFCLGVFAKLMLIDYMERDAA
jgi:uncharacterized NAD-dependent epimerase/dehydratase family protein